MHNHTHSEDSNTHSHEHSHDGQHEHSHEHNHSEKVFNTSPKGFTDVNLTNEYTSRVNNRHVYISMEDDSMGELYDQAWKQRKEANKTIITITEEMISRSIKTNFPESAEIVLYEDHSHDAPHAHVMHVVDASGKVLIDGTSDEWHDLGWTSDVDELVWDLYNIDRQGFQCEGHKRYRRIAIS